MRVIKVTRGLERDDPLLDFLHGDFTGKKIPHALCQAYAKYKGQLIKSKSKVHFIRLDSVDGVTQQQIKREDYFTWGQRYEAQ